MQFKTNNKKQKTKNEQRVTSNGIYQLLIYLSRKKKIQVGKKGSFEFPRGYYLYTGSAKNGLKSRIKRHLRKGKKLFWHIDYLLRYGKIVDILLYPENKRSECEINQRMLCQKNAKIIMPRFGSSDCRCETHLVYAELEEFRRILRT